MLTAGSEGAMRGKAWFEGVSLDEVSSADEWPVARGSPDLRPRLSVSVRRLDLPPY